jgi:hypothetical protein
MKIKTKIETEVIQQAGAVEAHCNTIQFINKSLPGVIVMIDGFPLATGDVLEDAGYTNEFNHTRYNVTAGAATFRLFIRRKIYTNG